MHKIVLEIASNEDLWGLLDKKFNSILIHKLVPNETVAWWQTDFKAPNGDNLKNLSVRNMEMDVQTDLKGLKEIINLNTSKLRIYQFAQPISNTLEIDRLPEMHRNLILKQNGLTHFFYLNFEFLTVSSFDPNFIEDIETNPIFEKRIIKSSTT